MHRSEVAANIRGPPFARRIKDINFTLVVPETYVKKTRDDISLKATTAVTKLI